MRAMIVFGTRPEAIKMFPVIKALRDSGRIDVRVCVTGQHRELLDQVLRLSGIRPDIDLDIMQPDQSLDGLTSRLVLEIGRCLDKERPDRVIVQGDTTTAMVTALAAYHRQVPVAHVEAGLRSGDIHHPWPEEVNRRIVAQIADLHFAPTDQAAFALRRENVDPATIFVTGNTVIDALHSVRASLEGDPCLAGDVEPLLARFSGRKIILVTSHRRENFGPGVEDIARAIRTIACRDDVAIVFPVHPNPQVRGPMQEELQDLDNVALIEPLGYFSFVRLLLAADLVLTDSGGVQEEAPAFGKPVLVMRRTTERLEGVAAGTARLVGTNPAAIMREVTALLDDPATYKAMSKAHSPFGDGQASRRIVAHIEAAHRLTCHSRASENG